jgi:hypothetical protein
VRIIPAMVVLGACTSGGGGRGAADAPPAPAGACSALEGKTFTSVTEGECGLGPSGPVTCHWSITFKARDGKSSTYAWQHSDVGESNMATCDGLHVTGMTSFAGRTYSGSYDPSTMKLVWENLDYYPP